jgi:LacI family transcriptional regulator
MNLKELAAKLGLSPTTVSRALNGYPEVNEATRERVIAMARRHNYRPNARATRLATGRALAVGHVIPLNIQTEMMNPIFADFITGAGETYMRGGYDMILSVVPDEAEESAYRDLKSRGTVDGVILQGVRFNDARIKVLKDMGLPFVVHGRSTGAEVEYNWVDVNNRRAFLRAAEFLLDLGHRRIALVNGNETMDFALRRRAGYADALVARGLSVDPDLVFPAHDMTEVSGWRAAETGLALARPATAFLCASMLQGMGVRRAIEARGLQMGRDVSVIVFDDDLSYLRNGEDLPIFTATRSSVREAGRLAAEMLLTVISQPGLPAQHKLLEAELILGQSTGPAPAQMPKG